jgi:hypothetical protein
VSGRSRQAVVDALATVPGIVAHKSVPDAPAAGDGWPVWETGEFRTGKLTNPITHTYSALVVLPNGYEPDTIDAADGLVEQVMYALSKVGTVDVAEPVSISVTSTSTMPGIRVRVTPNPNY